MQALPKEMVTDFAIETASQQPMSPLGALVLWLGVSALGWGTVAVVVASLI